jgi:hypothetical protein
MQGGALAKGAHFHRSRVVQCAMTNYLESSHIAIPAKAGIQPLLAFWIPDQVRDGWKGCFVPMVEREYRDSSMTERSIISYTIIHIDILFEVFL